MLMIITRYLVFINYNVISLLILTTNLQDWYVTRLIFNTDICDIFVYLEHLHIRINYVNEEENVFFNDNILFYVCFISDTQNHCTNDYDIYFLILVVLFK
jgi:hypothetical protein